MYGRDGARPDGRGRGWLAVRVGMTDCYTGMESVTLSETCISVGVLGIGRGLFHRHTRTKRHRLLDRRPLRGLA